MQTYANHHTPLYDSGAFTGRHGVRAGVCVCELVQLTLLEGCDTYDAPRRLICTDGKVYVCMYVMGVPVLEGCDTTYDAPRRLICTDVNVCVCESCIRA